MRGGWHVPAIIVAAMLACLDIAVAMAQEAEDDGAAEAVREGPRDLLAETLPLRTALHRDPTLAAPLDKLLEVYRNQGAVDELLGVYRAHVAQYPDNLSGQTVLVRLLVEVGNPEALGRARDAVGRFPDNAYLHYLLSGVLKSRHDPKALDALDKAVELQDDPVRKAAWVDEMLGAAATEGRRSLARKHLVALAGDCPTTESRLAVIRKMNRHRFFEAALETLQNQPGPTPAPETSVEMELEAAGAEVGLDRVEEAAARLDLLLRRLAADYWRRGEILARRLALVKTEKEREAIVAEARRRVQGHPADEAAVLDLAEVFVSFQRRREALQVLLKAGGRLPKSATIEERILELLDRLRDERAREEYLAERLEAQPDRNDLRLLQVKTRYLVGRPDEAKEALEKLLEGVAQGDRVSTCLELARFLRRSALPRDALDMFREVVESAPARLDVRRELAETLLALGRRDEVRALLADPLPEGAALENVLDLVQFMIQERLLVEARGVLQARVMEEPANLEIRTLLVNVYHRLGDRAAGETLIEQSRKLADTNARYRLWLESAASFYESLGGADFLRAELDRLDEASVSWTGKDLERRLIFAELAAREAAVRDDVAAMLREAIRGDPPRESRVALRRRLIEVLEKKTFSLPYMPRPRTRTPVARASPEATEVNAQIVRELEALAQDAPELADECHARRAMLHLGDRRGDLAAPLVASLKVERIQDAGLLKSLKSVYRGRGDRRRLLDVLERLTEISPSERQVWEEWTIALAASGDETRLRSAVRRLLAGIKKMSLSTETQDLLRLHLIDSYWRSIARRIVRGNPASLSEALPMVDSLERMVRDDRQWLWVAWTRAFLLGRLGRTEARDEAIEEMERVAARIEMSRARRSSGRMAEAKADDRAALDGGHEEAGLAEPDDDRQPRIEFPDGLTISLPHARHLLADSLQAPAVAVRAEDAGPMPPFCVRWQFETDRGRPVMAIASLSKSAVLICDSAGTLYGVDSDSGKMLWHCEGVASVPSAGPRYDPYGNYVREPVFPEPPTILADGESHFFVPAAREIGCYSANDGRLLWRAEVGKPGSVVPPMAVLPRVDAFLADGRLVTYEPVSGTVARIDPDSGKVLWAREFAKEGPGPLSASNVGASLSGDRLFVYGAQTAIVNLCTGEAEWLFEPERVREFPVRLSESTAANLPTTVRVPSVIPRRPPRWAAAPSGPYGYPCMPPHARFRPVSAGTYMRAHGVSANATPTYVDYLLPSDSTELPLSGARLAPAAVTWAAARDGGARRGRLFGPWLILQGPQGVDVLRTDLPLVGRRRLHPVGPLICIVGRFGCWFDVSAGSSMFLVPLDGGQPVRVDLGELVGTESDEVILDDQDPFVHVEASPVGPRDVPLQVAVSGSLLIATGERGILGFNPATQENVFFCRWPEEAEIAPTAEMTADQAPPPVGAARRAGFTVPPYQLDRGSQGPTQVPATLARVHGPLLLTLAAPGRVVALEEHAADE